MRKKPAIIVSLILMFSAAAIFLNMQVTTRQGVDFKIKEIRLPLYMKLFDFMNRYYNYKALVGRIIKKGDSQNSRSMKILTWTYQNIKGQPEMLPVVDDHVWHIIVRGYGIPEQFSDVFTTLCNNAGMDSFFSFDMKRSLEIPLSFVKIEGKWYLFDPYNGAYFIKKDNSGLSDIDCLTKGDWKVKYLTQGNEKVYNYELYFKNIPENIFKGNLKRGQIQSPLKRIMYEVIKWKKTLLK